MTYRILFLALFLLTPWAETPVEALNLERFKSAVNTEVAAARRVAPALGVHIVALDDEETVYAYNADTQRIIASNTKLFTTSTALDRLGPGYFFETEILIRGELRGGVLDGDLAVVGGGDPNLSGRHWAGDSYGAFRRWAEELRAAGIRRVDGDLVLVDGFFDREFVHPDWPKDQLTRWYEAPVAALSFNDNCVLLQVLPTGGEGRKAQVGTVPDLPIFRIASSAVTTRQSRSQWMKLSRRSGEEANVLTASGKIHHRTEKIDKWVTVADPVGYFGAALHAALEEEGIEVIGTERPSRALHGASGRRSDAPWRLVHVHRSDLLSTLEIINKRSQNFYTESLLKTLGASFCTEGSWDAGTRVVREFLAQVGLDSSEYNLADGSGMSRNNRFTPRQLTTLLGYVFRQPYGRELLASLPYSGERDLRWEDRLADPPYAGNVMAKTGTLNGVSTLSGYAKGRSGRLYAFSILCNSTRTNWQAQDAQDKIIRALIDHG